MRVAPAWTLGVLAGGRSRRYGSDKAAALIGGRSLLEHQIRRLAPPGVPVLVGTRPDGPGRDAGAAWVPDLAGAEGPLASIGALLAAVETPFLLAVPCDAPLLPPDLGDRMLSRATGVDAVLLTVDGVVEPFPAFLSRDLAPRIAHLLAMGERRAAAFVDHAVCALVPFETLYPGLLPDEVLLNVNTPAEHARADRLLGLLVDPRGSAG